MKLRRTPSGPAICTARRSVGEFADALAAAAAGRAERLAVADDQDLGDPPLAGERHCGDRAGFGAGALADRRRSRHCSRKRPPRSPRAAPRRHGTASRARRRWPARLLRRRTVRASAVCDVSVDAPCPRPSCGGGVGVGGRADDGTLPALPRVKAIRRENRTGQRNRPSQPPPQGGGELSARTSI